MMHSPLKNKVKNALEKIGNITSAHFDFSQLSSKYKALVNGENPNIFNPEMKTGCLRDLGIYCFYPAVDFFGLILLVRYFALNDYIGKGVMIVLVTLLNYVLSKKAVFLKEKEGKGNV